MSPQETYLTFWTAGALCLTLTRHLVEGAYDMCFGKQGCQRGVGTEGGAASRLFPLGKYHQFLE